MKLIKYFDFLNEEKKDRQEVIDALLMLFTKKPLVKMDNLPDEKGLYSLSGMKKYLSGQYTSPEVEVAHHSLSNDKSLRLKSIRVKIGLWNKNLPYWYTGTSDSEVDKIKSRYERVSSSKIKKEEPEPEIRADREIRAPKHKRGHLIDLWKLPLK